MSFHSHANFKFIIPDPSWVKYYSEKLCVTPNWEQTNKLKCRLPPCLQEVSDVSSSSHMSYRDKIYIIKDVILKLVEYGELNQTALVSFCGLNMTKHKPLIEDLEAKHLINKYQIVVGKRAITIYKPSPKGMEFCKSVLEPYEIMFPRVPSGIR